MSRASLQSLIPELSDEDLRGFEDLSEQQAEVIADAFHELREQRRREFDHAIDRTLRLLPAPLRRGLRRMLLA
jgi:hypothetical protein